MTMMDNNNNNYNNNEVMIEKPIKRLTTHLLRSSANEIAGIQDSIEPIRDGAEVAVFSDSLDEVIRASLQLNHPSRLLRKLPDLLVALLFNMHFLCSACFKHFLSILSF